MSKQHVHFACGAVLRLSADVEVERNRAGNIQHLVVYARDVEAVASPKLDGKPAGCFGNCPVPVRLSKRRELRAWVGEAAIAPTGDPTRCVLCRPTYITKGPD